jgi:hypothetical protein
MYMKKRIGLCIIITIMIILPSLTTVGALKENVEKCNLIINATESDFCPVHPINVTKKVWNSDIEGWVDFYEAELSEILLFNLTITYHKNCLFGCSAENIQVIDILPSGLIYEGSLLYNESLINGSQIIWNLSDDFGIILYDDECVSIEFEALVDDYGLHENYVEVFAFETGCDWGLYGESVATVYGAPPDPTFIKKVKDTETGEWVDETFQYVSETVTFKIELIYYGVFNLTDVKIVDYLPQVTVYGNQANVEPSYVSDDGSIVWWNLTEPVESEEPVVIIFDAYVWGRTGDCPYCGINNAEYTSIENFTQKDFYGADTAVIITDNYKDPELSYSPNNINFGEQLQGWTGSDTFEIWNSGEQVLTYSISESLDWIEVTPMGGTSEGEHDTITVSIADTSDMSGYYGGNIDISSNGGSGSVFVSIFVKEEEPSISDFTVSIKRGLCRYIKVNIENTGDVDLNNITWNITVTRRGLIKRTLIDENGTIPTIEAGLEETISKRLFGFGFIIVNVNVTAPGMEPIEETAKGFVIFRFIRLRRFL